MALDNQALSPEQAFWAMFVFLRDYWYRLGETVELRSVLSDIQLLSGNGRPADPAAWEDWLRAIEAVRRRAPEGTLLKTPR